VSPDTAKQRGPGRPRNEAGRQQVMQAAWDLVVDKPVRNVTMEAIAARSAVTKPTIYRWWSSRNALMIDAVFARAADQLTFDDSLDARRALTAQLHRVIELLDSRFGEILAEILAEGQSDPTTLASFRSRFFDVQRVQVRGLIERGIAEGVFDPGLDVELAMDLIYGPLYLRRLVGHLPLSKSLADQVLHWVLDGLSPHPSRAYGHSEDPDVPDSS
jgi:AcrR family transcriptional regulator